MEANQNGIAKKINSKLKIWVKSVGDKGFLEEQLWAINSLNLKSKFGYNLYLFLASPIARNVGSKLVFKGNFKQLIEGDPRKSRTVLLIVRYENGHRFLDLVGNKKFQLLSLLRIKSVDAFNFGFVRDLLSVGENQKKARADNTKCFLIYHFVMSEGNESTLQDFINEFPNDDVSIVFAGTKAAEIGRQTGDEMPKMMPLLFDGLLLFQADSFNLLDDFLENSQFVKLKNGHQDNFIAYYTPAF